MEAEGIPVPPTVAAADARWWPEGVVVKPRTGQGSVGVRVVESEAELAGVRALGESAIAQRRCSPPEVTVDAFASATTFRAVCRERIEVKAGVCTKARLFEDAELLEIVSGVAHALGLSGVLCVQAMRGPDGWEVTDINPRPGGATPMSAAAGVDVTAAAFADLWGLPVEPYLGELRGEPFVVRHYEELLRYPG
jgi:carbamoylphosphate synthase large subunit